MLPTEVPVEEFVKHNISLMDNHDYVVPGLLKIKHIDFLYKSGAISGYVACVIAICIIIVSALYYVKRRYHKVPINNADIVTTEAELQPMNRIDPLTRSIEVFNNDSP